VRSPDLGRDGRRGLLRRGRGLRHAPPELRGVVGPPAEAVDVCFQARDVGLEAEDVGDEGALGLLEEGKSSGFFFFFF